jgi:hypothetical protein
MKRRTFIQTGVLGLGALGTNTPSIYAQKDTSHKKSVIFLFLAGGMAHPESFNGAPDAKERYRSVNGYVQTKSGFYLGGTWQELAKVSELYSVVHSFKHGNAGHQGGTGWVNTGYNVTDENPGATQPHPSFGSIVSRVYGANNQQNGVPNYVAQGRVFGQNAAFLGAQNNPFAVDSEGKRNLKLSIPEDRFVQRYNTLLALDNKFNDLKQLQINDAYKKQAYDIMFGASSQIFDVKNETEQTREAYGAKPIGEQMLLARRLVESGTKFVTIVHGGWDMHSNIEQGMKNLVPEVDKALAMLLEDLRVRGLLDSTLVVVGTEFGRTIVNKDNGRDHYPGVTPLLLAGGNYIGGKVIGAMDKNGFEVQENMYQPVDLLRTILNHMDIAPNAMFTDFSGRPRYLIDVPSKVIV